MDIFKDLFKFGFSNLEDIKIIETDKKEKSSGVKQIEVKQEDILYNKTYECPICYQTFQSKVIKSGKNRLVKSDEDLKSYYSLIDPLFYDVLHCNCGYTAMNKAFDTLLPSQKERIKKEICSNFKKMDIKEYRELEDVIDLYKLALLNTIAKKGKNGERGLICLRIGWLYRDLKDEVNEKIFLEYALTGLSEALQKERFPLFGIDENTITYIIAALYFKLGKNEHALKWISSIIVSKDVSTRLKDKARDLKYKIKNDKSETS